MRRLSRNVGVALAHLALDFGGAGDRIHDARELHQHAVAGQLDDAALDARRSCASTSSLRCALSAASVAASSAPMRRL